MVLKGRTIAILAVLLTLLAVLQLSCGRQSPPPKDDKLPPSVISFSPGNNQTNVRSNVSMSITFSEPVYSDTIVFRLSMFKGGVSVQVPCTMSYSGTSAVFTPVNELEYSTTYSAWLSPGVKDLSRNTMVNETSWSFMTGVGPDTTPPTVVDIQPSSRKTGVSTTSVISIMFSEPMDPTTISPQTIRLSNEDGGVVGTVLYNGATAAAIFKPDKPLNYPKDYTVKVMAGVKDLANLSMMDSFISMFSTVTTSASNDVTPPIIDSVFPQNKALNIDVNAPISVTFSEPMDASTILPDHFIVSEGTTTVLIPADLKQVGTTAIFTPHDPLKDSTNYIFTITRDFKDLAGNGMLADYIWSFTTGTQATDTVQPSVRLTFPSNAQTNVPIYQQIVALFSEKILASSMTPTAFVLIDPRSNSVPGLATASGAMAYFTPAEPLLYSTVYTAVLSTGVTDLAGNPLFVTGTTWSFTTESFANATIMATSSAGGSIIPYGSVVVSQGNSQKFDITPAANYHIADVQVDGSSVGPVSTYTFYNVISDHTINADFAINNYKVEAVAAVNGTLDVTTPSPATVNYGSPVSFKFNANANYHVASVTNTCGGAAYNNTSNSVTTYTYTTPAITAPGCSVTASFAINIYTVTAVANSNGTLDGTTPSPVTINHGSTVSFKFNANASYHVESVTSTCGGAAYNNTSNSVTTYTYTTPAITAGCSVTASFANNTYALTVSKAGTGAGNVTANSGTLTWIASTGTATYNYGTSVTLTATADASSTFTGWSGEGCTGTGACVVSMTAARNVTATFTIRTFIISAST